MLTLNHIPVTSKGKSLQDTLGANLLKTSAIEEIDLTSIILSDHQPRRYLSPTKFAALVHSIDKKGLINPVLVTPLDDSKYKLVYGHSRFKAHQELNLTTIKVIIRVLNDEECLEAALIENLLRNDLSVWDEVEGIIALVSLKIKLNLESTAKVIREVHAIKCLKRNIESEFLSLACSNVTTDLEITIDDPQDYLCNLIIEVVECVSNNSFTSFVTNKMKILALPEYILEHLRDGILTYTKANLLNNKRIKSEEFKASLVTKAVESKFTIAQIRAAINAEYPIEQDQTLRSRWQSVSKSLNQKKLFDNPDKSSEIEELLQRLEELVA